MNNKRWGALLILLSAVPAAAQEPAFSTVPMQAVYEYQLNYELPWQRWYGGPGLSLGGTMPTQQVFGYSSLNGLPLPAPLGAGVYVNGPAPHGAYMPYPMGMGGPFPGPPLPTAAAITPASAEGAPGQAIPGRGRRAGPQEPRFQNRAAQVATSPAARRASLIHQVQGDRLLRERQWTQAYVQYRSATDLAPERPEAHFRLGLTFTALKQYASAIREFKRSLDLDPTLPQSGETLTMILGTEPELFRDEIIPVVTDWAFEDMRDPDRLLVLGLLLHFNDDPRGSELFEAAQRTTGENRYFRAFLAPEARPHSDRPRRAELPQLNRVPDPPRPDTQHPNGNLLDAFGAQKDTASPQKSTSPDSDPIPLPQPLPPVPAPPVPELVP